MKRLLVACVLLGGCTTAQVTAGCDDVHDLLSNPLVDMAPIEVRAAAAALRIGSYVCGTPEYAAARNGVLSWIRSK